MSAIPEDVMKAAQNAWAEADNKILKTDAYGVIARAILAERERSRTVLSEAEQRAKDTRADEGLKDLQSWVFQQRVSLQTTDPDFHAKYGVLKAVWAKIRALIPSEPHDAEGRN